MKSLNTKWNKEPLKKSIKEEPIIEEKVVKEPKKKVIKKSSKK